MDGDNAKASRISAPPLAEVIRKLFPDIEDYEKGERQCRALTVNHWDEELVEIDVTRSWRQPEEFCGT